MKKMTLIIACLGLMSLIACKKDRVCECTTISTDSSGNTNTDPVDNSTYKDIKRRDAKSLCQKTTIVRVNSTGETSSYVSDCKLK